MQLCSLLFLLGLLLLQITNNFRISQILIHQASSKKRILCSQVTSLQSSGVDDSGIGGVLKNQFFPSLYSHAQCQHYPKASLPVVLEWLASTVKSVCGLFLILLGGHSSSILKKVPNST